MAKIINANGEIKEVTPQNGTDFKLKEVQDIVGGHVEIVHLKNDAIMIISQEPLNKSRGLRNG